MDAILVSSCLLGNNCKYNGGNNLTPDIDKLSKKYHIIAVCPETLGKLPIPRVPSEIVGDRVLSKVGTDVTANFKDGAIKALNIALKYDIKFAILKESSPSCGSNMIYDGSFSGKKIPGAGIFSRMLIDKGIKIYNENNFRKLLEDLV